MKKQGPEFLMSTKTGVVFVKTKILAKRKDMVPYDFEKKRPVSAVNAPEPTAPVSDEVEKEKERAAAMVKEWFGRDVSKVSKKDLADYAMAEFNQVVDEDSKLKMVLAIEQLGE